MQLKFQIHTKIQKPLAEVFDAVCNPTKLSGYFTTGGASGPLTEGATVVWRCRREPHPRPMGPGTKMTAAERADLAPDAAFGLTGRLRPIRSYRRSG